MTIEEALAELKSWNLKDDYADFSTWSDAQLLKVRMSIELSNIEEYDRFMAELQKRNLVEQYWSMRKPTH